MKNPFVYGETVSGTNFCNREREIGELVGDIKNGMNVIIFSPRRYGKTSLIKKVLTKVRKQGILTFYVDLYPAVSRQKFIEIYARAISEGLPGRASTILKKLKAYMPRIIPKVVMDDDSVHFEFEFGTGINASPGIDDLLESAGRAARQHKKSAVVVFDEFQEIANFDDGEIERKMRSVFQGHRNVSYIFMGSKNHLMRDIFNNPNRPFYKSGRHFPLKKIEARALAGFARKRFKAGAIQLKKAERDEIINVSECHPYYFQMLCHILWEVCLDGKTVTADHIETALDTLVSRESSAYVAVWEGLTAKQRQVLIALAVEKSPAIFGKDFLGRYHLGASSSVQRAVNKLLVLDLIQRANGSYEILDLFFKRWLLRRLK
jgi:hypothetical protein